MRKAVSSAHYEPPTAGQVLQLGRLLLESGISKQGADALLKGLVSDLFTCDTDRLDRNVLRAALNLTPVASRLRRNRHGHAVFTVMGSGRDDPTGVATQFPEISTSGVASRVLRSETYDVYHRLESERQYALVIVPARQFKGGNPLTETVNAFAQRLGYESALAGVVPRLATTLTKRDLEKLKLAFVVALHEPVHAEDGVFVALGLEPYVDGIMVHGYKADVVWPSNAGFIYLDPLDP